MQMFNSFLLSERFVKINLYLLSLSVADRQTDMRMSDRHEETRQILERHRQAASNQKGAGFNTEPARLFSEDE